MDDMDKGLLGNKNYFSSSFKSAFCFIQSDSPLAFTLPVLFLKREPSELFADAVEDIPLFSKICSPLFLEVSSWKFCCFWDQLYRRDFFGLYIENF